MKELVESCPTGTGQLVVFFQDIKQHRLWMAMTVGLSGSSITSERIIMQKPMLTEYLSKDPSTIKLANDGVANVNDETDQRFRSCVTN